MDEYCERIIDEYRKMPPVEYQIGFPVNYKEQEKKTDVKYKIAKCKPTIINIGRSLNIPQTGWISSMHIERDIILNILAPWGGNEENTWAYITSGGTEGNFMGIQFGLKKLKKPLLIYSTDVHYSLEKAIDRKQSEFTAILQVSTLRNGEMDCTQMLSKIRCLVGSASLEDIPSILVVATLGTAMKGACDDVTSILESLCSTGVSRDRIFVHLDAAFNGAFWHLDNRNPNYKLGIEFNSITICGYKWHGADICGIFAVYHPKSSTEHIDIIEDLQVEDIGITSCRNGFNAISWMVRYLQFDWQREYDTCCKNLHIIVSKFKSLGIETFVNPGSLKVCTPLLPQAVLTKYSILHFRDVHLGDLCRIVVCPHVTEEIIDQFFNDLQASDGFVNTRKQF